MSTLRVGTVEGRGPNRVAHIEKAKGAKLHASFTTNDTLRVSMNVSSIIDVGTGQCGQNAASAMSATYFSAVGDAGWPSVTWNGVHGDKTVNMSGSYGQFSHVEAGTFRDGVSDNTIWYGELA
jgi:hypothetical protein